jgi:hypothetical protein
VDCDSLVKLDRHPRIEHVSLHSRGPRRTREWEIEFLVAGYDECDGLRTTGCQPTIADAVAEVLRMLRDEIPRVLA